MKNAEGFSQVYRLLCALLCLVTSLFGIRVDAQLDEIGIHLGGAAYFGDLTPRTSIFSTGEENIAVGLSANAVLNDFLSVRVMASHLRFMGDDAMQKDENRRNRNLHFRNHLWDGNVLLDLNLSDWLMPHYERLQFHVLGGVGVFNHNPEADLDGRWIELQPLGIEGQMEQDSGFFGLTPYALTQVNVPVGLRVEFEITQHMSINLEYIHRILFTDYLDDVSTTYPDLNSLDPLTASLSFRTTELEGMEDAVPIGIRGNKDRNDAFASLQLTLVYRLMPSKTRIFGRFHR